MLMISPVIATLGFLTLGGVAAGLLLAIRLWTRSDGPFG
jgi:hypothetical protein